MSDYQMPTNIPEDHTIVGFVVYFKVLDEEGRLYWAQRSMGMNDMEQYGLACSLRDNMQRDVMASMRHSGEELE